jgi:hypothetical protein
MRTSIDFEHYVMWKFETNSRYYRYKDFLLFLKFTGRYYFNRVLENYTRSYFSIKKNPLCSQAFPEAFSHTYDCSHMSDSDVTPYSLI